MRDSGPFCPSCGDPIDASGERPPAPAGPAHAQRRVRALCDACYLDRFDLVDAPDRRTVKVCSTCGAVRQGNRWVDVGARDYTEIAVEAVREDLGVHVDASEVSWGVEPEQIDASTIRMHATFSGTVRGTPVEESVTVPVTLSRETCTRCGRIAGDYYAGIVQVRAVDRDPTSEETDRAVAIAKAVVADMEATGDRDAFVTGVAEVDGGLDIKVSTTKIGEQVARRLVAEFGGRYSTAETLVTEDEEGNEVYRVAYAVRLPPYLPGDVIDPQDGAGPVLVRSVKGAVKGVRLTSGRAYESAFEEGDAPDARRLGRTDDASETTLVAVEDDHAVQVIDPETSRTVTVPRPDFLDPDAETVRVLKSRAGLHVLPDE